MIGFLNGLTQGFAIVTARHFGAEDATRLRRSVSGTFLLVAVFTILLTVLGLILANPLLTLLNTPNEIIEDAAAYNTTAAKDEKVPVTVEQVEMLETGKDVRITYKFSDTQAYSEYMGEVLFYGTVSEALLAGYHVQNASLSSVKDGTPVTGDWIQTEAAGKHILITNQAAEIYCPYAVTHISTAAVYNENGSVSNTQSDDIIYVSEITFVQ